MSGVGAYGTGVNLYNSSMNSVGSLDPTAVMSDAFLAEIADQVSFVAKGLFSYVSHQWEKVSFFPQIPMASALEDMEFTCLEDKISEKEELTLRFSDIRETVELTKYLYWGSERYFSQSGVVQEVLDLVKGFTNECYELEFLIANVTEWGTEKEITAAKAKQVQLTAWMIEMGKSDLMGQFLEQHVDENKFQEKKDKQVSYWNSVEKGRAIWQYTGFVVIVMIVHGLVNSSKFSTKQLVAAAFCFSMADPVGVWPKFYLEFVKDAILFFRGQNE
ncbi:hypothetical protein COB21_05630 [Candidatus Aerophobetes bacterium]|uniref:Uncharacterized protein n=1 Tax=Aerophobetes bacterium TaxID=2030807 RepID=A0A2A4WZG6_UNCAE|nr:MAG: hypothetical protein COB21_05630 [Candidatus Aerophobetes bacterium]